MRLADINPQSVKKIDKKELMNLHKRVHQLWGGAKAAGFPSKKMKKWLEDIHQILVDEMEKRNINHKSPLLERTIYMKNLEKIQSINEIYFKEAFPEAITIAALLQLIAFIIDNKRIKKKIEQGCGKPPKKEKWYGTIKDNYKYSICYHKGYIKEYDIAIKKIEAIRGKCKYTKSPKVCEAKLDAKISKLKLKIEKHKDFVKKFTKKLEKKEDK
ncbi:MAG: hypothetical protein KatS3mg002_0302 [Candidatus Woesearchaeota archaeon]|nr:MAG: hypothetical protein KatS3mg002_0302 [Candidatus Woesearchaeota archaeon]